MSKKTLERPLNSKEIKPVNPKGNQSWIFIEGLMLKLKLQSSGHLMRRNDSLEKTLLLGKIEGRKRLKEMTEYEMSGWHHQLDGHEFEQAPGDGEGQGNLTCYIQSVGSKRVIHNLATKQQHNAEFSNEAAPIRGRLCLVLFRTLVRDDTTLEIGLQWKIPLGIWVPNFHRVSVSICNCCHIYE